MFTNSELNNGLGTAHLYQQLLDQIEPNLVPFVSV